MASVHCQYGPRKRRCVEDDDSETGVFIYRTDGVRSYGRAPSSFQDVALLQHANKQLQSQLAELQAQTYNKDRAYQEVLHRKELELTELCQRLQAAHTDEISQLHSSAEARCSKLQQQLATMQQELERASVRADANEYRASRYISLLIKEEQRAMRLGADRAAMMAKLVHMRLAHLPGPLTLADLIEARYEVLDLVDSAEDLADWMESAIGWQVPSHNGRALKIETAFVNAAAAADGCGADWDACGICYSRRADCLLLPCNHLLYCGACLLQYAQTRAEHGERLACPMCRTQVLAITRIPQLSSSPPGRDTAQGPATPAITLRQVERLLLALQQRRLPEEPSLPLGQALEMLLAGPASPANSSPRSSSPVPASSSSSSGSSEDAMSAASWDARVELAQAQHRQQHRQQRDAVDMWLQSATLAVPNSPRHDGAQRESRSDPLPTVRSDPLPSLLVSEPARREAAGPLHLLPAAAASAPASERERPQGSVSEPLGRSRLARISVPERDRDGSSGRLPTLPPLPPFGVGHRRRESFLAPRIATRSPTAALAAARQQAAAAGRSTGGQQRFRASTSASSAAAAAARAASPQQQPQPLSMSAPASPAAASSRAGISFFRSILPGGS